jgi:flagellar basal-body rod protein FlgB
VPEPVRMPVSDHASGAIQTALRGLAARQRVIATNVANAQTPGYLAGRVDFESALREVSGTSRSGSVTPTVSRSTDPVNLNGNNVSLDNETVGLVDTTMRYQLMVEAMNAKFRIMRASIRNSG